MMTRYVLSCPASPGNLGRCCVIPYLVRRSAGCHVKRTQTTATDQRAIGFGQAALHDESRAVAQAAEGSRNNCLNRAAYNLGQLVGDNILTRWDVEQALLAAALAAGLDEKSSWRTIQSGLKAGMNNPRRRRYGR